MQKWECSQGCDVSTSICKHLEKNLPQMSDGWIAHTTADTENLVVSEVFNQSSQTEDDFVSGIRKFGIIADWDIQLLTAYYFNNFSLREILTTQHYKSKETIRLRIKTLLKQLKERGYGKDKVKRA